MTEHQGARWKRLLSGSGPLPRRVALSGIAVLAIWAVILGIAFLPSDTVRPEGGALTKVFDSGGLICILVGAPATTLMVVYLWALGAGAIPLAWARSTSDGVVISSLMGRLGVSRRRVTCGDRVRLHLIRDRVNPAIHVVDVKTSTRTLRLRCQGPIATEDVKGMAKTLDATGCYTSISGSFALQPG